MSLGRAALFKYSRFKYIRSGGRNEADIGGGTGVGDAASQAVATRRRDPGAVSATNATGGILRDSEAGVDVGVTLPAGHSLLGVEGAGDVLVVASKDVKPSNSKSLLRRRIWRTWQRSRCRAR
ncbi:hypothetical protein PC128_g23902 [Phytophthora cactorum]|nr:hypothetical protein PC128_g23902 [Phytophthora cactorum]